MCSKYDPVLNNAEKKLNVLRLDAIHGSVYITKKTIEIVQETLSSVSYKKTDSFNAFLKIFLPKLYDIQPSMALLFTYVNDILFLIDTHKKESVTTLKQRISEYNTLFLYNLTTASDKIAEQLQRVIPFASRIVCFSASSTIEDIIKELYNCGKNITIYCAESRPKQEGVAFAERLSDYGIPTILMTDAGLFSSIPKTTHVLVGADAICNLGVINKIGTFPLAIIAAYHRKPFYVACQEQKILPFDYYQVGEKEKPAKDIYEKNIKNLSIRNYYFDYTPFSLISKIFTNNEWYDSVKMYQAMKKKHIHQYLKKTMKNND